MQDLESQRINIIHEEKPSSETIAKIKSYGFKWSWKVQVWTRQLNNNTLYNVKRMLQEG